MGGGDASGSGGVDLPELGDDPVYELVWQEYALCLKEKFSKVLISTQRRRRLRHVIAIALMHFFMLSELQFF